MARSNKRNGSKRLPVESTTIVRSRGQGDERGMKPPSTAKSAAPKKATTTTTTTTTTSANAVSTSPSSPSTTAPNHENNNSNSRQAIEELIALIQQAIRRPLYVDLALQEQYKKNDPSSRSTTTAAAVKNHTQKQRGAATTGGGGGGGRSTAPPKQQQSLLSWTELLVKAARLLPHCTYEQHGEIMRLAAILLLGYLLPHSTGNDFYLLQNAQRRLLPNNMNDINETSNTEHHHHDHHHQQQHGSSSSSSNSNSGSSFNMDQYILNMSLEERLTSAAQWHVPVQDATEIETLSPCPTQQAGLDTFLKDAIRPLLLARPVHERQVDLVHLLAMMIQPSQLLLRDEKNMGQQEEEEEEQHHRTAWIQAQRFATSRSALHFHLHYGHRIRAIQLVRLLVLPNDNDDDNDISTYLQCGVLRHLRACLKAFSSQGVALSTADAQLANQAMVTLVAQQDHAQQQKEWDALLHQLVDDPVDYHTAVMTKVTCSTATTNAETMTLSYDCCPSQKKSDSGSGECPHVRRGKTLALFLEQTFLRQRSSSSGTSRLSALHGHILSSLADAIEWQMDAWTKHDDGNDKEKKKIPAVCLLASLLFAAKHAFPLATTTRSPKDGDDDEGDDDDHNDACETLLESAVNLLRHSAFYIRAEATDLLVRAFSHRSKSMSSSNPKKYARSLLEAIKMTLGTSSTTATKGSTDGDNTSDNHINNKEEKCQQVPIPAGTERLVGIVARASPAFAIHLANFVVENKQTTDSLAGRFLAAICINCPAVAHSQVDKLLEVLLDSKRDGEGDGNDSGRNTSGSLSIIASLLSSRQAQYFTNRSYSSKDGMSAFHSALLHSLTNNASRWDWYRMACHAFQMGDFCFAATVFRKQLLPTTLNEKHYLWMSVLENVSTAESVLSAKAAKGIPQASNMLHAAISYLQSLNARFGRSSDDDHQRIPQEGYDFQICFLHLRLDMLDLMTVLRQLTREMRLTGAGPVKYTRNFQHLKNTVHSFEALSARFAELNQQYGISFQSHSSTTSLVALQRVAMFLSRSTQAVFADALPSSSTKASRSHKGGGSEEKSSTSSSKINANLPILQLIRELDELVVQPMDASPPSSIDPLVRSTAMLELLDGLLMVPCPYPRDFLSPRPRLYSELSLSADPTEMLEHGIKTWNVIESYPSLGFALQVNGHVHPALILQKARRNRPIVAAVLWLRLLYDGPLQQSDEDGAGGGGATSEGAGGGGATDAAGDEEMSATEALSQQEMTIRQGLQQSYAMPSPATMRLFPNCTGQFQATMELPPLLYEGMYRLQVKLGCRDCLGAEWELAVSKNSRQSIVVRNSRSK